MKKIILYLCLLSLAVTSCISVSAYELRAPREKGNRVEKRENDIYFEDFSSYDPGANPLNMEIYERPEAPVEVAEAEVPDCGTKNVLRMADTSGSCSITIDVPKYSGPLYFETRMKFKKTTTDGFGFIMDFMGQKTNAIRLIKFSGANDGLSMVNNELKDIASSINFDGEWFTIKARFDSELNMAGFIVENPMFKEGAGEAYLKNIANVWYDKTNGRVMGYDIPFYQEYEQGPIDQIYLSTYGSTNGEYLIDYIRISKDTDEFRPVRDRAAGKEAEKISNPSERLVPGKTNIIFKGEVKYIANPVISINNRTMIDFRTFSMWYGMLISENENGWELKSDDNRLSFEEASEEFSVNGKSYTSDVAPVIIDKCLYIPLRSFSEAMGDTVSWSPEKACVIIE